MKDDCSVCIASIIRIKVIWALTQTMDISWAKSDVFIWSSCEPSVAVISGCLPTLRPLFMKFLGRYMGSHHSDPTQSSEPSALETISKKRTRPIKKHTGLTTFGDSQFGTQLGMKIDNEGEEFEMSKGGARNRILSRLSGSNGDELKLRDDDEVQLTSIAEAKAHDGSAASIRTLATGQSGDDEHRSGAIVVKQTFEWGEEMEQDPKKRTSNSGPRL